MGFYREVKTGWKPRAYRQKTPSPDEDPTHREFIEKDIGDKKIKKEKE
jgi:hypothetical protein